MLCMLTGYFHHKSFEVCMHACMYVCKRSATRWSRNNQQVATAIANHITSNLGSITPQNRGSAVPTFLAVCRHVTRGGGRVVAPHVLRQTRVTPHGSPDWRPTTDGGIVTGRPSGATLATTPRTRHARSRGDATGQHQWYICGCSRGAYPVGTGWLCPRDLPLADPGSVKCYISLPFMSKLLRSFPDLIQIPAIGTLAANCPFAELSPAPVSRFPNHVETLSYIDMLWSTGWFPLSL